jgi:predicted metal-dependent hydrolase
VNSEHRLAGAPLVVKVSPTARAIRLRVDHRSGALTLTVPRRVPRQRALDWAAGQGAWAERALAALPPRRAIAPGETIPYRGIPHLLDWSPARPRRIATEPGRLVAGGPREGLEGRVLRWLRREALALLAAETEEHGAKAGVMAARVSVGDPVSRWGSCSARRTIRYSWRLILAPDFVRRATVAHEVAHLVHMNHGPEFHALAARLLGADPAPARAWLKREGAALHRFG